MEGTFSRTEMLLGSKAMNKLKDSAVLVFGAGGVGSYAIEAIARMGIGKIGICDADCVSGTNVNRQLYALNSTIGKKKILVAKQRIIDINPFATVDIYDFFYDETTYKSINLTDYDYIIDAIDTMKSKVLLISNANDNNVNIISALSAGNKLDPLLFEVSDIYSTSVCPIAKILRKQLKDIGILRHKVVYSKEPPVKVFDADLNDNGKKTVGSISFVPSVMGLILAKEVVLDIIGRDKNE